mmetsp:Transcript_27874/g.39223  ORF Transcript_27874/g.39223 Transcript_27874/m.39223 type:complete len:168 (-) Transcript_27874:250-753(-)
MFLSKFALLLFASAVAVVPLALSMGDADKMPAHDDARLLQLTPCIPFKLVLTTDSIPGDISWEVKNFAGTVVLSDNDVYYSGSTTYTEEGCFPPNDGDYTVIIRDSYGDGLGSYEITWNGAVVASGENEGTVILISPSLSPSLSPSVSVAPSLSNAPTGKKQSKGKK